MICDLAEVYHILNYEECLPTLVGTLCIGLSDDSRVKRHISGAKYPLETILLARIADELSFLSWTKTKDAQKNTNRPKSILQSLLDSGQKNEEYATFSTMDEFERMWNAI